MNTEQYRLLEKHKLSINMIFALASVIETETVSYCGQLNFGRQYGALQRRGLLTNENAVTENGTDIYREYCQVGETPLEYSKRLDEEVRAKMQSEGIGALCPTCGQPAYGRLTAPFKDAEILKVQSSQQPVDVNTATVIDDDLEMVIDCWAELPIEFRKLVVDAAFRIAGS
jgi:hypothetical protein